MPCWQGPLTRGLSRVGFYNTNIAAGDTCDGDPAIVRWGPETSSCLSQNYVAALGFTDVQAGDIIVPVWETALARAKDDVIYRFKQPERPDTNTMNVDLKMNGNGPQRILGAGQMYADTMTQDDTIDPGSPNGKTLMDGSMMVRNGQATMLKEKATTNGAFKIYSQTGAPTPMTVAGTVNFTNANINVANTIQETAPVTVTVANPAGFGAQRLASKDPTQAMVISQINPLINLKVAMKRPAGSPAFPVSVQSVDVNGMGKSVAVTGTLDTRGATLKTGNIYAAQMNTIGARTATNVSINTNDPAGWQVGSIHQIGTDPDQGFKVDKMDVQVLCDGAACPDNIIIPPPDGPY